MRRTVRILGTLLMVGGFGTIVWAVVVWQWQDPFTAIYTTYQQHKLKSRYHKIYAAYQASYNHAELPAYRHRRSPEENGPSLAAERLIIRREARQYRLTLTEGGPLGRLIVPRLGLNMIAVNGTDSGALEKGPGRYSGPLPSYVPGEGELVYIAGHRTTYLAPFAHIDSLRPGDKATLELPYATFHYVVTRHVIVDSDDLSVLDTHGHEVLALQACHPRFFATHRYIAYAKLIRVVPSVGPPYAIDGSRLIAAAA
jgi:sortase A